MIKYNDNFNFKGFHDCKSVCHVEVYEKHGSQLILVTEINSNTGTSVTNAIELILDQLSEQGIVDKNKDISVFENYEGFDSIDVVEIYHDSGGFGYPSWYPSNKEIFLKEKKRYED